MKKASILALSLFICFAFFANNAKSQDYNTGLGLRFGGLTSGLTVKHFTSKTNALEGILSIGRKSFLITGLFEKHAPLSGTGGLKVLYGVGGHIGFFQDGGSYYYNNNRTYTSATVVGIDGILGLDYKFKGAPINMSLDIKPFVDFFGGNYVYFDGGLSLRYTF